MIIPHNEPGKSDSVVKIEQLEVGNSAWYAIPQGSQFTVIELVPSVGGTAKVQMTVDDVSAKADTVDGVDWDAGEVTARTQQGLLGGGFIRIVVSDGTATLTARATKS